jgi:cell division septation protein DedD
MDQRHAHSHAGALLVICALAGCGTVSDFADRSPDREVDTTRTPAAQTLRLETRTDTIRTERSVRSGFRNGETETDTIRFMVQIGAFKNPRNASKVQQNARTRFRLPVINDYHTKYSLYQIRIGFFTTKGEAELFRKRLQTEYPGDYSDAWVVTLKR